MTEQQIKYHYNFQYCINIVRDDNKIFDTIKYEFDEYLLIMWTEANEGK